MHVMVKVRVFVGAFLHGMAKSDTYLGQSL